MPQVIYLDENNVEVARKEQGRGRPPTEKDANGNYIVRLKNGIMPKGLETLVKPEVTHITNDGKSVVAEVDENTVINEEYMQELKEVHTRTHTAIKPVALTNLTRALFALQTSQNGNVHIFEHIIVRHETGLTGVDYNSLYLKIEIDEQTKDLSLWRLTNGGKSPDLIIKNSIE
jgi:hypothetical protein